MQSPFATHKINFDFKETEHELKTKMMIKYVHFNSLMPSWPDRINSTPFELSEEDNRYMKKQHIHSMHAGTLMVTSKKKPFKVRFNKI